jgi:lactoylglutathione lyase
MDMSDFPAPSEGFVITYFLVVSNQDRSRKFYKEIFDGKCSWSATRSS